MINLCLDGKVILNELELPVAVAGFYERRSDKFLNPLNAELNSIFHLLALLGARHILHISGIRVNQKHILWNTINYLLHAYPLAYFERKLLHQHRSQCQSLNS